MKRIIAFLTGSAVFIMLFTVQVNVSSCKKGSHVDSTGLTSQPANNVNEVHLFGGSGIDETDPNSVEISACAWTSGGTPVTLRGVFKFDLSSIPAGSKIGLAKLSLYSDPAPINGNLTDANFGTNNAMLIQQVSSPWDKNINWATQPESTTDNQVVIASTSQSQLDLIDVDVTKLVQSMFTGNNYGFMIKLQNETYYNSRIFCSSKNADASKHPKLFVQYLKP